MPVKSEDKMNLIDYLMIDPITEPLLPDDIWKKFELDFPDLTGFDDIFEETTVSPVKLENPADACEIRNHDCMWAGHCGSKEHPSDETHALCLFSADATAMRPPPAPPAKVKQEAAALPPPQQSLLKPAVRAANAALPQTPPMSDDEEVRTKRSCSTSVLKLLHDAIEDCDLDEDSDLCDYFEDKEEVNVTDDRDDDDEEQKTVRSNIRSYQFAAESDHSYHKGKAASANVLGIDTPSDSEEEIDVVSVVDKKFNNNNSNIINSRVFSLPNNPSNRDRHQIQRRMATAISKKKMSPSIKTILPVRRKSSPTDGSPAKRKSVGETCAVKRSKQYRVNTPYKRRNCGHSSDSEPEPSEKRSLHNNMERQRRIDLRNAFEDLRVLVPEVSKKERAAKVVILREAAQYCDCLTGAAAGHAKHLEDLKRRQEWLRQRVSQLRRNLAAKR